MTNTTKSKTTTKSGISIKSRVRAGGIALNHNQAAKGLRVKTRVRAGSEMVVTKVSD